MEKINKSHFKQFISPLWDQSRSEPAGSPSGCISLAGSVSAWSWGRSVWAVNELHPALSVQSALTRPGEGINTKAQLKQTKRIYYAYTGRFAMIQIKIVLQETPEKNPFWPETIRNKAGGLSQALDTIQNGVKAQFNVLSSSSSSTSIYNSLNLIFTLYCQHFSLYTNKPSPPV